MFCSDYMFHFLFASELVSTVMGLHLLFRSNLQNLCQWRIFFSKIRMIESCYFRPSRLRFLRCLLNTIFQRKRFFD